MKNVTNYLLMGIVAIAMFVGLFFNYGCSEHMNYEDSYDIIGTATHNTEMHFIGQRNLWVNEIDNLMKNPPLILQNANVKLIGYEFIATIENENKQDLLECVLNDHSMFPYYISKQSILPVTRNQIQTLTKNSSIASYDFFTRDTFVKDCIKEGMSIVKLQWEYKGCEEYTYCVVSDHMGVVYDNLITNTMILDEVESIDDSPIVKTRSESGSPSRQKTWRKTCTAFSVLGYECGKVEITHTGYYINNELIAHDYSAFNSVSWGNSHAEAKEISKCAIAYVYAISSPVVTINVSWLGSAFTLSFSTTAFSHAGDTGTHTHMPIISE